MRKGEQTRREIIRKAAPIFNQKGYDKASNSLREKRSSTPGRWQWMRASKERRKFRIPLTA